MVLDCCFEPYGPLALDLHLPQQPGLSSSLSLRLSGSVAAAPKYPPVQGKLELCVLQCYLLGSCKMSSLTCTILMASGMVLWEKRRFWGEHGTVCNPRLSFPWLVSRTLCPGLPSVGPWRGPVDKDRQRVLGAIGLVALFLERQQWPLPWSRCWNSAVRSRFSHIQLQ